MYNLITISIGISMAIAFTALFYGILLPEKKAGRKN